MSKDYNHVVLLGNIAGDPRNRTNDAGTVMSFFELAVGNNAKDEKKKTNFIRISLFGKLAEVCGPVLKKGRRVLVVGKLSTYKTEKEGQTVSHTEVIATEINYIDRMDAEEGTATM